MKTRPTQILLVSRLLFCLMLVTLLSSGRGIFAQAGTNVVAIDAGGTASGIWVADEDYSGGSTSYTSAAINTSLVANPAPQEVYQTERYGDFTYTIPNLTAGASYTVNLSFAEIYWTAAGAREFNVLINGTQVLTNFDVFATAGGENIATVESFPATASASGTISIQFTTGAADLPKVSGIQILSGGSTPTSTDVLDINASGPTEGSYVADEDFVGGADSNTANSISTAGVTNPAPEAVYQAQRYGNFTYTLPGFTAGTSYTVRLHFAEFYWDAAGSRLANVLINGTQVLTNFDIFAAAGGENIAVVEQFNTTANTAGQIVIQFVSVKDNAAVNGIEIETSGTAPVVPTPPTGLAATAVSSSQINLSWTASTTAGVTYNVFQAGNMIANVSGTTYSNTGLTASTTYSYTVEATDSAGASAADGPVSATTLAVQSGSVAPPTSLTAVGSSSQQIDLRWVASTTAAPNTAPVNYLVYRSTTPSFTPSAANLMGTTIGIANYLDSNYPVTLSPSTGPGVQSSTTYYYQVVASTSAGTSTAAAASATSLPASASTAAPVALTGLAALAENANEIDLLWNSTNSGVGTVATEYYVYRSTTPSFTPAASNQIGTTKSNWFQDELVSASTQYYYQVLANNSIGVSPSSTTVSTTTPALNPNLWGGRTLLRWKRHTRHALW